MPVALDMTETLPEFVKRLALPVARISTYEGNESLGQTKIGMDFALQEQHRSLGYAE